MAFTPNSKGSALPRAARRQQSNDAAGFALRYGPLSRSPYYRAIDTGLRPDPFPDQAASLLPGLLTATRTGLTPASDDELTNKDQPPTRSTSALLGARIRLLACIARARCRRMFRTALAEIPQWSDGQPVAVPRTCRFPPSPAAPPPLAARGDGHANRHGRHTCTPT